MNWLTPPVSVELPEILVQQSPKALGTVVIVLSFPLAGGRSSIAFETDLAKDAAKLGIAEMSAPKQPMAQAAMTPALGFYVSTTGSKCMKRHRHQEWVRILLISTPVLRLDQVRG